MTYTNQIIKALGKRRMKNIVTVETYGELMVDIVMCKGWFYDNSETMVAAEYYPHGDETWHEFLKYLKSRVDDFEYKPELESDYKTLPNDSLELLIGLDDEHQTNPCNDLNCDYCN